MLFLCWLIFLRFSCIFPHVFDTNKLVSKMQGNTQGKIKPIFHWKLCPRWLYPMQVTQTTWNLHGQGKNFALLTQRNLYSTDLRWVFTLGVTQILAFLDTDMLVYPKQNFALGVCVGQYPQREILCFAHLHHLYHELAFTFVYLMIYSSC